MSTSASEATNDYSTGTRGSRAPTERPGRTRLALAALAMVAAHSARGQHVPDAVRDHHRRGRAADLLGLDHHSIAMLLLGVAVVPMALGTLRGARPAMVALAAIGAVVLLVAFTVDLPAALDEGVLAVTYEGASASPGIGFYVETFAGALLIACGGLMLLRSGRPANARAPGAPHRAPDVGAPTGVDRPRGRKASERGRAAPSRGAGRRRQGLSQEDFAARRHHRRWPWFGEGCRDRARSDARGRPAPHVRRGAGDLLVASA